jgi:hypothetical protein
MGFRRPHARGGFGSSFWVGWIACALGLASCASDDKPHDGTDGGSSGTPGEGSGGTASESSGGSTPSGGRAGGSAGLSATGGELGTGGTNGGSGSADGGRTSGEGGVPSNSGGTSTPAGAPSSAGNGDGGAAGSESEPGGAAGHTAGGGAGGSGSEVPELNGCTTYLDRTDPGASRKVTWDASIAFAPERCLKIRVHQEVEFDGDFDAHPLEPLGGDMPSPFSSARWTFSRPGVFGYICSIHSEMTGAIWVVP